MQPREEGLKVVQDLIKGTLSSREPEEEGMEGYWKINYGTKASYLSPFGSNREALFKKRN